MKNNLVVIVVVAIVSGGLGFFGGMQYQKANTIMPSGSVGQFQPPTNGQGRPEGFPERNGTGMTSGGGLGPVTGEILEVDGETITVQTPEGDSKIVIYSGSTNINKTSEGSSSDLEVGEEVMVIGSEDANGTVTAQTISIGGGFRGMPSGQPTTEENN
ncbi:hypothetical protein A2801_01570 [Candidatus Woesebacteria bacterium RIFCSPHIGHO2_01_FULL_41_10]|uniref:Uncharacterized protein n=1 Tax=Candidatus Woesebacteria bacterium RIFCSPHIGHO2_01_FULL_41_10 TaxID=1802500 RepID=A0A1F7YQB8_9BACT|nr:MAG: hypothetical protein A2801_01570 [Candidatus Woesebacteria bacterium RIFCSPHIGHO2_01_FULL_41_10]